MSCCCGCRCGCGCGAGARGCRGRDVCALALSLPRCTNVCLSGVKLDARFKVLQQHAPFASIELNVPHVALRVLGAFDAALLPLPPCPVVRVSGTQPGYDFALELAIEFGSAALEVLAPRACFCFHVFAAARSFALSAHKVAPLLEHGLRAFVLPQDAPFLPPQLKRPCVAGHRLGAPS